MVKSGTIRLASVVTKNIAKLENGMAETKNHPAVEVAEFKPGTGDTVVGTLKR